VIKLSDIKISYEVRPCILEDVDEKALFHCFTNDGNAIVEFDDGTCTTTNPCVIRFVDNKFSEYDFTTRNK